MGSSQETNKVVGEAVEALSKLERAFEWASDYDADLLPRETVSKANTALAVLDQMLTNGQVPAKDLKGREILNLIGVISEALNDSGTQKMLGTAAGEFSKTFRSVQKKLTPRDLKRVESTLFKQLDKEQ